MNEEQYIHEEARSMNMDYASLYPTPIARIWDSVMPRLNSFSIRKVTTTVDEGPMTPEDFIENWENANEYKLRLQELRFPEIQMITARPIGLDLVPVQPLSAPQGVVHYLDYVYAGVNEDAECPIEETLERSGRRGCFGSKKQEDEKK